MHKLYVKIAPMSEDKAKYKAMGRPPKDNPMTATLPQVRCTPEQLDSYKSVSAKLEMSLAALVRKLLDREVKRHK